MVYHQTHKKTYRNKERKDGKVIFSCLPLILWPTSFILWLLMVSKDTSSGREEWGTWGPGLHWSLWLEPWWAKSSCPQLHHQTEDQRMAPRKEVNNSMCQIIQRKPVFIKGYFLEATSQIITETTDILIIQYSIQPMAFWFNSIRCLWNSPKRIMSSSNWVCLQTRSQSHAFYGRIHGLSGRQQKRYLI